MLWMLAGIEVFRRKSADMESQHSIVSALLASVLLC